MAPVLEQHGGRIVKNLGDSFMALFPSATDAVRASLELVEAVREGSMNLRVGMATGDVEVIDGDAFGENVNLASRILSRTPEGEVWFSHATLLCMNQSE
ncbi:MAG: adenylate/guanylate cyclase domain-containing protein, partial [bacterium]